MKDIDNKPFTISGKAFNGEGKLEIVANSITMPDGSTLADTIVSLRNRIDSLEKEVDSLKRKS